MFFLCVHSLFVSFMFQKIFIGYMCILGLPWPGICLLLLGPPHCFIWMLWDFSPRILIWKTGWWKFTLPARDKQPGGLGVILCCVHFFPTLCTAVPDMSYPSWSLPCSPALCVWETSRPTMGEPGLGKLCLSLDLMAQPLLKALGLHRERWAPRGGLCTCPVAPALIHSPEKAVRWVLWARPPCLQHHAAFPGRRAVSQPSIWFHWHCTQQKFLKVGGILMALFPIFQCWSRSPLFLYSLGPFCHFQKEVA